MARKKSKKNKQTNSGNNRFANLLSQNSIENFMKLKSAYDCLGEELFFAAVNKNVKSVKYSRMVLRKSAGIPGFSNPG